MTERDDWLMGALAAEDAYRGEDPPWPPPPPPSAWEVGRRIAAGEAPLSTGKAVPPGMGSVLGMGEAGRHLQDAARTVPGAIVRGGVEAAKFAGHLGALDDPELDLLGQQGAADAERQIEAKLYQPQTALGDYTNAAVKTVANPFNALGAGGMAVKQGVNLLSGLAGEWGARAYPEHPDLARFVFGFGPGVAGHALPAADNALRQASGNTVGSFPFGGKIVQPAPASRLLQRAPDEMAGGMFAHPEFVPPTSPRDISEYVYRPQRLLHPGIYKDPRVIAEEASRMVAPEHPALKQLFGVTREDLYDISKQGTRRGNLDPKLDTKAVRGEGSGSYAADAIMNPRNAQRQIDALAEAERYPQLTHPMDAWYVMDPMFQQMVKLVGREQAIKDYKRFNATTAPFSAGSDVLTEINRGTAANMYAARGDYPTFARNMGLADKDRGKQFPFPDDLRDVKGHAYHDIQSDPVARYLATGEHGYGDDALKIWLYHQASGVPETGFQTKYPVLDAHLARSTGMSDVRTNAKPGRNMMGPEYRAFAPWYSENVAAPLGIEAVPAQGRQWGVYAPQTGVDTPIGAPKLELIAQSIWERAHKDGISPYKLRDDVLTGKAHATWLLPAIGAGLAVKDKMGAIADQSEYQ